MLNQVIESENEGEQTKLSKANRRALEEENKQNPTEHFMITSQTPESGMKGSFGITLAKHKSSQSLKGLSLT